MRGVITLKETLGDKTKIGDECPFRACFGKIVIRRHGESIVVECNKHPYGHWRKPTSAELAEFVRNEKKPAGRR